MSTIARDPIKPLMMVVALGYVMMLAAALIWLHMSPLFILAMTLGGVTLAACTLRPFLAIHGLIMLLNLQALLAASSRGDLAAKAMGGIIVLGWLLNMAVDRKRRIRVDGFMFTMIFLLLWCGSLIMIAIDSRAAAGRTMTFVQLVIGTIIFGSVIDSRARLRNVYWTFVAWTTLSAFVGIAQYLSGMPEAVGLLGNRNGLAMYVNIALICAYLLHQSTRRPGEKLILAMSIPVLFIALALTFSRGGLIVMGVTMIVVFARAAKQRRFLVLIASSALIAFIAMFLPDAFWNRAGTIVPSIRKQEDTFGIRVRLWEAGARMVADHPVRGVGPGNFTIALPRYTQGMMRTVRLGAHNSYVAVAAEMGLVGLALFLLVHYMAFRRIRRASDNAAQSGDDELVVLALAAEACILAVALSGLSGHLEYTKYLWIFFGLVIATERISRGGSSSNADRAPGEGNRLLTGVMSEVDR